jgi:hypothetical protein
MGISRDSSSSFVLDIKLSSVTEGRKNIITGHRNWLSGRRMNNQNARAHSRELGCPQVGSRCSEL